MISLSSTATRTKTMLQRYSRVVVVPVTIKPTTAVVPVATRVRSLSALAAPAAAAPPSTKEAAVRLLPVRTDSDRTPSKNSHTTHATRTFSTVNGTVTNGSSDQQQEHPSLSELRDLLGQKIVQRFVPRYGWTTKAVTAAILDTNDDEDGGDEDDGTAAAAAGNNRSNSTPTTSATLSMAGLFATPSELVNWYMEDMNRRLLERRMEFEQQQQQQQQQQGQNNSGSVVVQQQSYMTPYDALKWRLEQVIPLAECRQWHTAMAVGLSTPETTRSQLHELIDIAMMTTTTTTTTASTAMASGRNAGSGRSFAGGSRSVEQDSLTSSSSEYYRTALGAIFVATELHLLSCAESIGTTKTQASSSSSSSNDYGNEDTETSDTDLRYAETWNFLNQRLNELDDVVTKNGDMDLSTLLASSSSIVLPVMTSLSNEVLKVAANATLTRGTVRGIMSSSSSSSSSSSTSTTFTTSSPDMEIAMKATSAVASSLLDGMSSLVLPSSFLTTNQQQHQHPSQRETTTRQSPSAGGDGTRAEDYGIPSNRNR